MVRSQEPLSIENEISSKLLSQFSPKVALVAHNIQNDLGLFRLLDQYPPSRNWIDLNWIMDRDELYNSQMHHEQQIGCIGYSNSLSDEDTKKVKDEAEIKALAVMGIKAYDVSTSSS